MTTDIRVMRTGDLDGAVRVWRAANLARDKPPSAERVTRIIEKLNESSAIVYVAAEDDRIEGMLLLEPYRAEEGVGALVPDALHLSMTFIDPSAQGRGLGTRLVGHALDQARNAGLARVSLWTGHDNTAARRLYESLGMKPFRTRQITRTVAWVGYETNL
ncbi:MAG: GNAT family N-acetyltransferase [Austwickia sp.]|nr:MAG: GNAT family N-acetyltransferase [Austwickia sp.]